MAIGTAVKTDDGYPILEAKDSSSGLVAAITGTLISGHETLDVNSSPMIGGSPVANTNPVPILDGYQLPISSTWTSATAVNSTFACNTAGYDTVVLTLVPSGTITAGNVVMEVYDGVNWLNVKASRIESYFTDGSYSLIGSPAGTRAWQVPVSGFPQFRVRLSTAIVGAGSVGLTLITSSAPDTSVVTVGVDPGTMMFGDTQYGMPSNTNSQTVTMSVTGAQSANAPLTVTGGQGGANPSGQAYLCLDGYMGGTCQVVGVGTGVTSILFSVSNNATNWININSSGGYQNISPSNGANGYPGAGAAIYLPQGFRYIQVLLVQAQSAGTTSAVFSLKSSATPYSNLGLISSGLPVGMYVLPFSQSGASTYTGGATGWIGGALTQIKGGSGSFYGGTWTNLSASTIYLNIYNASSITYGTTIPTVMIAIPAGQSITYPKTIADSFNSNMYYTVSTSLTTLTAPATNLVGTLTFL